jgi:hypothetical protein
VDESTAVSTDEQLVHAGPVAQRVIDQLGLSVAEKDLEAEIGTEILTPQLLRLTMTAPDDRTATTRVGAVADAFLQFRAQQLVTQASSVTGQLQKQVDDLKSQVAALTRRYHRLSTGTLLQQSTASDVADQRARDLEQISTLEQQIEVTSVNADAVVAASRVVDPPAVHPAGRLRQFVLPAASGLIGGAGLALGTVTMLTLLSNRVRARSRVAAATGVPVRYAIGPVTGVNPLAVRARRRNRVAAGAALRQAGFGAPGTVSVLADVDASREASKVLLALVKDPGRSPARLELVDLTDRGRLSTRRWKRRNHRSAGRLQVVRPRGPVAFAGPDEEPVPRVRSLSALQQPSGPAGKATIVLADVDPGVGVMSLVGWSDTAVLLVAAGRTSFERLQATAESFQALGPRLELVLLVNADRREASSLGGLLTRDEDDADE